MHFIFGENSHLIDKELESLLKQGFDLETLTFEGSDSISGLISELSTISLFADTKVIIVRNHDIFTDKDSQVTFEIINLLKDVDEIKIIFVLTRPLFIERERNAFVSFLVLNAKLINCLNYKPYNYANIVQEIAISKKVTITNLATKMLIEYFAPNFQLIEQEISKYAILTNQITDSVVLQESERVLEDKIFAFSNALTKKDTNAIISNYFDRINVGDDPIMLLGQVASLLVLATRCAELLKNHLSVEQISFELSSNLWRVKEAIKMIRNVGIDQIEKLLSELASLDLQMKTGKGNSRVVFDHWILKFVQ